MRPLLVAAALLAGCLPDEATDPGPAAQVADARVADPDAAPDAAPPVDAGAVDAGAVDAAAEDAGPDAAAPDAAVDAAFMPVVDFVCPGGPTCAGPGQPELLAGAAALPFSDLGFERPLPAYLRSEDCNELQPEGRCGVLTADALRNCGADRLCPGDDGYEGPDADGSEGDLAPDGTPRYDYFRDCGFDHLCPGDDGYEGPDEGEGNGRFDGLWLAGFNTNRPAYGVRDHAWARTVALQQGGTLVTITVLDAVGLFYDEVEAIREEARALLAVEAPEVELGYVLVSSTHSHEVPDTMGQWGGEVQGSVPSKTGVVPRYLAHLRSQAARSIADAVLDLRPARLVIGQASTGMEGLIRDSRPPIVVDDTLGVAQLIGPMGETIATLVNWGNHPESLGSNNNFITSDFAGALRHALEDGLPSEGDGAAVPAYGGVSVFVQGMVGGLMTPLGVPVRGPDGALLPEPSFARNDAIGHRLARMAAAALADAEEIDAPALAATAGTYRLPARNQTLRLAYLIGLFDRSLYEYDDTRAIGPGNLPKVQTQAAIITLGPLTLYSVPGELFPEVAVGGYDGSRSFGHPVVPDDPLAPDLAAAPPPPYLHDTMPGRFRWVVGLGLDELGYMVPPYDFKVDPTLPYLREAEGDHYEETNSIGPEIVPYTIAVLNALATALAP